MLGEYEPPLSGRTIVVKSHHSTKGPSLTLFNNTDKCVIIYRNPRDAMISELNRIRTGSHTGLLDFEEISKNFTKGSFEWDFIHRKLTHLPASYLNTYDNSNKKCKNKLELFYENIVENSTQEIEKVLDFIGFSKKRLFCVKENQEGKFKRKKSDSEKNNFEWMEKFYNEEEREVLRKQQNNLKNIMNGILPSGYDFLNPRYQMLEVDINEGFHENLEVKFSYEPVNYDKSKGYLIVAFTDINYLPATKVWFDRIQKLGYGDRVKVYAVDNLARAGLLEILNEEQVYNIDGMYQFGEKLQYDADWQPKIGLIWSNRIKATYRLLHEGYTVMLTDIDSVWNKYRTLKILEILGFQKYFIT